MEKQVDGGAVVDAMVFSDGDLSFANCLPNEAVDGSEKDEDHRVMTYEEMLNAAYGVFCFYAKNHSGKYLDNIVCDLRLVGFSAGGRKDVLRLCELFKARLDFKEKDRMFFFSFKEEGAIPTPRSRMKLRVAVAVTVVVFSLFFLAVVALVQSKSVNQEEVQSFVLAATPIEHTVQLSSPSSVVKDDVADLNELIDNGSFSRALSLIRGQGHGLPIETAKVAKVKIGRLVVLKADSLAEEIGSLLKSGEYERAFRLEKDFNKDVFQLAGKGSSRNIRSKILTAWVLSCDNLASKSEAVKLVTSKVQDIIGSRSYRVAEDKDGVFYLEYGL